MDLESNEDVIVTMSDTEVDKAFRRLSLDDFCKIGMFASVMLGKIDDRDPKEVYHETEMRSAEVFIEEILNRFDLYGTLETGMTLLLFNCTLLMHVAGTIYGNAQLMSHESALNGLPLDPLDEILAKSTPPRDDDGGVGPHDE